MGKIYKQSLFSVILTFVGIALGVAVTVLSVRYFPQEELGFTQNLIRISSLLSQCGVLGFHMALLIKGQSYKENLERRNAFFSYAFFSSLLGLSIITFLLLLFSNLVPNIYMEADKDLVRKYVLLFPFLTFLSGILLFLEAWLQGNHRTATTTFSREILTRLLYIVLIFAYGFNYIDFSVFITVYVLKHFIPLGYLLWKGRKEEKVKITSRFDLLRKEEKRHLWSFSNFHLFSILSLMLIHQMDILLLGPLSGLKDVAIYSVAALVVNMLRAPMRAVATAITPALSQHYHKKESNLLKNIFQISRINAQIYGVFMTGLIIINLTHIPYVLSLIHTGYDSVHIIVGILLIGQFFEMTTGFNHELIGISNDYKVNFWLSIICAIIFIFLQYSFIIKWGIIGAAWATSIGFIIFNIAKSWFVFYRFKIKPIKKEGWYVILLGATITSVIIFIPILFHPFIDLILRSMLFLASYWFVCYKINISTQLNQFTHSILKVFKLR